MQPQSATLQDYAEIMSSLPVFWGERDVRALHHPMFVHEFRDTALSVRAPSGEVAGYLLGFINSTLGYVHLVGVRDSYRRRGVGRSLYDEFTRHARDRGATSLKAITTPGNRASIHFHRAIGMSSTFVADYGGPGQDRVVFRADLVPAHP
jgi:ribosomal protein S18 acetylase RimI-like enzyme